MKRDLVIFGDSFGEEQNHLFNHPHPLYIETHKLLSFHQLLRESGKFNTVVSHAVGGTSLWSQFKVFKEKYKGNELIVWFITHPCRFVVNFPNGTQCRIASLPSTEHQIWESTRRGEMEEVRLLNSAKDYMLYMQDSDEEFFKHTKILEEIKQIVGDENLVFVDSFNFFNTSKVPLFVVPKIENEGLFGSGSPESYAAIRQKFEDIKRNHMTEENHRLLADQIIKKIETGEEIDMSGCIKPKWTEFSKYFKPRK